MQQCPDSKDRFDGGKLIKYILFVRLNGLQHWLKLDQADVQGERKWSMDYQEERTGKQL